MWFCRSKPDFEAAKRAEAAAQADEIQRRRQYRAQLIEGEREAQSEYEKAVMTLSGGALGFSMAFLKDILHAGASESQGLLLGAWICWGLSLSVTLCSHYTSAAAFRAARERWDMKDSRPPEQTKWNKFTAMLNPAAGLIFFVGLLFLIGFLAVNPLSSPKDQLPKPVTTTTP